MARLIAESGMEINKGDLISDWKGNQWKFESVHYGKVLVSYDEPEPFVDMREFYPTVFPDYKVVE